MRRSRMILVLLLVVLVGLAIVVVMFKFLPQSESPNRQKYLHPWLPLPLTWWMW